MKKNSSDVLHCEYLDTESVDNGKRRSLKIMAGSSALAGSAASAFMSSDLFAHEPAVTNNDASNIPGNNTGLVSINIMVSKSVAYDWILMENLSDHPLRVTNFNPGVITYLDNQLDLNRLLPTTAGNIGLLLHSDYAWSESLYDLPGIAVGTQAHHQLLADTAIQSISADTRVVKCWAKVINSNAEVFLGDVPGAFA